MTCEPPIIVSKPQSTVPSPSIQDYRELTGQQCSVKTRLQVQTDRPVPEKLEASGDAEAKVTEIEHSDDNEGQHHHYTSTLDAIRKITIHDGIAGLYAGMPGSLVGVASTNFAYFYWYTVVRDLYLSSTAATANATAAAVTKAQKAPGTIAELSLGALAGALAQLFTIPVAVVTTRQQTQPRGARKGLFGTGKDIINSEDGVTGLWRGLKASLVLVVNPAITYAAYQRLRELLFPGKPNLRPREAFGKTKEKIRKKKEIQIADQSVHLLSLI